MRSKKIKLVCCLAYHAVFGFVGIMVANGPDSMECFRIINKKGFYLYIKDTSRFSILTKNYSLSVDGVVCLLRLLDCLVTDRLRHFEPGRRPDPAILGSDILSGLDLSCFGVL